MYRLVLWCASAGIAILLHSIALALLASESVQPEIPMSGDSFEMVVLNQTEATALASVSTPEPIEEKAVQPTPPTEPVIKKTEAVVTDVNIDSPVENLVKDEVAFQDPSPEIKPGPDVEPEATPQTEPEIVQQEMEMQLDEEPTAVSENEVVVDFEEELALNEDPQDSDVEASKNIVTLPRSDVAYLNNTKPTYPASARRRGLEGLVLLEVTVETDGYPSFVDIKQSSGHRVLDNAARGAVEDWKFIPAEENGKIITAKIDVPIRFTLR